MASIAVRIVWQASRKACRKPWPVSSTALLRQQAGAGGWGLQVVAHGLIVRSLKCLVCRLTPLRSSGSRSLAVSLNGRRHGRHRPPCSAKTGR